MAMSYPRPWPLAVMSYRCHAPLSSHKRTPSPCAYGPAMTETYSPDSAPADPLNRVALQEVSSAVRQLRASLRTHLQDHDLLESAAVAVLSGAALAALSDVALTPERYGLDPFGLEVD